MRWMFAVVFTCTFLSVGLVRGQEAADLPEPLPVLRDLPGESGTAGDLSGDLLGETFESRSAGIAFRAPAGAVQVQRPGGPDQIVQYHHEQRNWILQVRSVTPAEPLPLLAEGDHPARRRPGMLEMTLRQLTAAYPSAEVLREDVLYLPPGDVGLLIARYADGSQRRLLQQGILKADERLYYIFTLTSPGAAAGGDEESAEQADPDERLAVATFGQMLDTIRVLDRSDIRADQNQRLIRTRALLVTLHPERIRRSVIAEQWLRVIRNGEDIGYSYVVEEIERFGDYEQLQVGIRTGTRPEQDLRVDSESWLRVSLNLRHETWSKVAVFDEGKEQVRHVTEFGASDRRMTRVLDERIGVGTVQDPRQPPVREVEIHSLEVRHLMDGAASGEPIQRELPPFYLSQAMGHMLPRFLPLHEAKSYLFASYISEQREVMLRYVDVKPEQEVALQGRRVRAVPIEDRIGLEGPLTTHYMSPDGTYLGSLTEASGILIVPSDAPTLRRLWSDPDLTRPDAIEQPSP